MKFQRPCQLRHPSLGKARERLNVRYEPLRDYILSLPARMETEGEYVYGGRRNLIKKFQAPDGTWLNVKRYHAPRLLNALVYSLGIRRPKGLRAYEYPSRLATIGVETPEPVAYLETRRHGLLRESYLVTVQCTYTHRLYEVGHGSEGQYDGLAEALGRLAGHMHNHHVMHRDFSPGNVLWTSDDNGFHFSLVDINRMYFGPVTLHMGCQGFRRLWGTRPFFTLLAQAYARERGFDEGRCVQETLKWRDRFWRRYARHHEITFNLDTAHHRPSSKGEGVQTACDPMAASPPPFGGVEGGSTIGFDAKRIVRNASGLGNYGRTLVSALAIEEPHLRLLLYAPDPGRDDLRAQVGLHDNLRYVFPEHARSRLARDLWRRRSMVQDLVRDHVDLYHGLSGELPAGLRKAGVPAIVTIHDLIFLRHPEWYNPIDVLVYRHKFYASLREATHVVAISECTRRDILHYGHFPADRISVIYQSCDTRFRHPVSEEKVAEVTRRYRLPDGYILSVGTIEPRKNALLIVRALEQLPDRHLVIVGRATPYARKIAAYVRRAGLSDRVHMLSGVSDDDLMGIYHGAACFVYPSRYEGFGIPIIEAIQCGLPVVAATGSCLEEAGGPDCLYVDPDDASALASAIAESLHANPERIRRSQQYITRFENAAVAQQMLDLYQRVLRTHV